MKKFNHFRNDSLEEVLKASDPTGKWIDDFVHSKNPKFAGKSKEQRIRMALGASYGAKNEESKICSICEHDPCICDDSHGFVTEDEDKVYTHTVVHNKTGNVLGKYTSLKAATRAADKKDLAYGGYAHRVVAIKEAVEDKGEYDYEGQMARTQLQTTMRNCQDLIGMIEDGDNMPEWVQSKITLAQDYITSVRDYLQSKEELGEDKMVELGDLAVKKALKHRVLVTYSDPNHTMVSKRSEKQQKHIRVPIHNKQNETIYKGDAIDLAKQYVKKQGYKVHDAEHAGLINVKEGVVEAVTYEPSPGARPNKAGHTLVGFSFHSDNTKHANIMKHGETGKYFAAGGSSSHPVKSTTFHDTPEDAVKSKKSYVKESSQTKEQIDDVHKTARYLSAKEGVVQHVNKDPETGEHHVSDWYHHENTVATYNNGRKKRD